MRDLDHALFYGINRWPEGLSPFFVFLSECTKYLPVVALLVATFLIMLWHPKTRLAAIHTIIAFPLANEATDILKAGFKGLRPCVELSDVIIRVNKLTSFGTASAHSANMAAVALVMTYFLGWRWGSFWIAVAFFTGLSRIYVGVHYPYQVLLGWACGLIVAFAVIKSGEWLRRKLGKANPEAPLAASSDQCVPESPTAHP